MIIKVDCGCQTVASEQLRDALREIGLTVTSITDLKKNDHLAAVEEAVSAKEIAALLNKHFGRNVPCITDFIDRIRVEVRE